MKIIVRVLNGVIAALSLLGIICYAFGPVWTIGVKYHFTSKEVADMVGNFENVNLEEAIGPDGLDVKLDLDIHMGTLFGSLGSDADAVVDKIIDKNASGIAKTLSGTIEGVTRKVVSSVAKNMIHEKVHDQVREYLKNNSDNSYSDDDIVQKLENAGLGDEFISQKTDELFNAIYSEDKKDADQMGDIVVGIVEEACQKLQVSDEEFKDAYPLKDSDVSSIKKGVEDAIEKFTSDDGTIDPDAFVNGLISDMLKKMNGKDESAALCNAPVAAESGSGDIEQELKTMLKRNLPSEVGPILVWVLRAGLLLVAISAAIWIYTIVKVIMKFVRPQSEQTVKLKLPIIFGWLPFLILFCVPTLAFSIMSGMSIAQPGGALEIISKMAISFYSIGWVALLSAGLCFGISIFYMVLRRQNRKAYAGAGRDDRLEDGGDEETEEQEESRDED